MFVVMTPAGRAYGRLSLSGPFEPVDAAFAYTYDTREEAQAAASFTPDGLVAWVSTPAPEFLGGDGGPILVDCPTCHYPESREPGQPCGEPCV